MRATVWLPALFALLFCAPISAHPLAPSVLSFVQEDGDRIDMRWRSPAARPVGEQLSPRIPEGCRLDGETRRSLEDGALLQSWLLSCSGGGLSGKTIGVRGIEQSSLSVVVRWVPRDGPTASRLIDARAPTVVFAEERATGAFPAYLALGVEHLLTGWDHIAFVLGLMLLIGWRRKLVVAITSFTLGHSITLALAVLGIVRVPSAPVEILIAASLLVLALEIHQGEAGWVSRHPWTLPGGLGLLHGLGFASVMREAGLPSDEIPIALLGFNLGVEVGQLLLVAAVGAVYVLGRAVLRRGEGLRPPRALWAHALGAIASFWILERTWGVLLKL